MFDDISVVAHQLDKNLQGRLTFNGGMASGINAMLIYDQDKHHLILGCQVGSEMYIE